MPQALLALAGWTVFAFAGAYHWTILPLMAAAVAVAVAGRPKLFARPHRAIDLCLLLALAGVGFQLVPAPAAVRNLVSPAAAMVAGRLELGAVDARAARPLSLDPGATVWALAMGVTTLLIFWVARQAFERGGTRRVVRGVAWCGLALAVTVFVQRTLSPHHIYGFWAPITRTSVPTPLGPFVNRNDLATWLLLAIPLVIGYALARITSAAAGRRGSVVIASALDARTVLLLGSVVLMTAALVASLSRSGLVGLLVALLMLGLAGGRRLGAVGGSAFATAAVALLLLAVQYANMSALAFRLGDSLPADVGGRLTIWRETWPMAKDFTAVGIGVGAFARAMLVYQQSSRALFFNHAHNEYLQVLVEGGLLVAVPVGGVLIAGAWTAWRWLRRDASAMFWLRAGAISGLAAVAVQSVWDTGLRMPANAVLFALVSAIALHDPAVRQARPATSPDPVAPPPGRRQDGQAVWDI